VLFKAGAMTVEGSLKSLNPVGGFRELVSQLSDNATGAGSLFVVTQTAGT